MPAILTHYAFVKSFYTEESKYSSLVFLGAQGPDVFFFLGYLKKRDNAKEIRHFGHHLHNIDIAEIYYEMINYIKEQNTEDQDLLYAYLKGMMYHYVLDRNAHPYIFYRTGAVEEIESKDPGYYMRAHVLFESNLDVLVSNHTKTTKKNINCIKTNKEWVMKISKMYKVMSDKVFNYDFIKDNTFYNCYLDMCVIQKLFYSPLGFKRMLYYPFRKKIQLWVQTNPRKPMWNDEIDYLNLNKTIWKMPDTGIEKDDSFFDITGTAKEEIPQVDNLLELSKTEDIKEKLYDFTHNVNHDGDIIDNKKQHFDFCYNVIKKIPF